MESMPSMGFPPIPGVHTPLGSDGATREEAAAANGDKHVYDAAPGAIATHEMSAAPEVRGACAFRMGHPTRMARVCMDMHRRTVTMPTHACMRTCAPRQACWPGIILLYMLNSLSERAVQG